MPIPKRASRSGIRTRKTSTPRGRLDRLGVERVAVAELRVRGQNELDVVVCQREGFGKGRAQLRKIGAVGDQRLGDQVVHKVSVTDLPYVQTLELVCNGDDQRVRPRGSGIRRFLRRFRRRAGHFSPAAVRAGGKKHTQGNEQSDKASRR